MWTLWNKIYLFKTVFENFIKWGLKGGMYFDAVVVEVEKYLLFFQIGSGHTVLPKYLRNELLK